MNLHLFCFLLFIFLTVISGTNLLDDSLWYFDTYNIHTANFLWHSHSRLNSSIYVCGALFHVVQAWHPEKPLYALTTDLNVPQFFRFSICQAHDTGNIAGNFKYSVVVSLEFERVLRHFDHVHFITQFCLLLLSTVHYSFLFRVLCWSAFQLAVFFSGEFSVIFVVLTALLSVFPFDFHLVESPFIWENCRLFYCATFSA